MIKQEKKLFLIGFLILLVLLGGGYLLLRFFTKEPPKKEEVLEKELNIFNWEAYLSEEVIKDFEERFGVKVNLDTYEDSGLAFSVVQSKPDKYDLFVIEDDYLQLMKNLKLLSLIDHQKIPNLKNLKKEARETSFDFGNVYCVPYVAGYTGIVINTKYVKDYDGSDSILWDDKYKGKIILPNSSIGLLMNAFFFLGFDPNNPTIEQIKEAAELAIKQKDLVLGYYDPIKQRELLIDEKAWVALIYTTEVPNIIAKNPNLKFFAPKEGVLLWMDSWCIPKDAPHKNLAHAFLNYLLEPEVSAKNSQDIQALMANQEMEMFLEPEFLTNTKGLDFPESQEIFNKSGYGAPILLEEEAQTLANQLWLELGMGQD